MWSFTKERSQRGIKSYSYYLEVTQRHDCNQCICCPVCPVCKVDTDTFSEAEKALGVFSTLLLLIFSLLPIGVTTADRH